MTPSDLVDRFRLDVVDVQGRQLWTDDEVWGYLDDAQTWFCRLTGGLRDATSAATRIDFLANDTFVDIDPSIQLIRSARLASTGKSLVVFSHEDVVGMQGTTEPFPFTPHEMDLTGPVVAVIIGMEEGKLRLIRIPTAADTINMVIERLPAEITEESNEFEIRREHHLSLLLWMKHLAYAKQDADTFDKDKSEKMKAAFVAYCDTALTEKNRRNSKPRLIAYGGL